MSWASRQSAQGGAPHYLRVLPCPQTVDCQHVHLILSPTPCKEMTVSMIELMSTIYNLT